jgi:tetratricopeptide (TPR) repeat protein
MNDVAPHLHPEPEALAAFLEGHLAGLERKTVVDHLSRCEECRSQMAAAAELEREEAEAASNTAIESTRSRFPMWWLAAAVAILAVGGLLTLQSRQDLVRQAQGDERIVDGQVTMLPHAPIHTTRAEAKELSFEQGTAVQKLEEAVAKKRTVENLHRLAVGYLATGKSKPAEKYLDEAIALQPHDPELLSDLAAAQIGQGHYEDAERSSAEALRLDPSLKPAAFNHAFAVQQLAYSSKASASNQAPDVRPAIAEWKKYLQLDPNGPWADEAEDHIKKIKDLDDAQ